jgi:RsiW-degrading membrane proteinase PrsW (M82 family)
MILFLLLLVFIGIAAGLAWYLIAQDHGEREPIAALWLAAGMGVGGALIAVYLEKLFISTNNLTAETARSTLLASALGVGVIEEACKFIPLAIYLYKQRYFNEHTDGVIYFALAGLGFGLPENILYTLQYGTKIGTARLFMTPFFHATTTGIAGYYLAKAKLSKSRVSIVILPLLGIMALHGIYDFGLLTATPLWLAASVAITLALSGSLFVFYTRARQLDEDTGISAVGHNNFCRSCGWPNPEHNLYCTHCGKNA